MAKAHPDLPMVQAARELISDPARWCRGTMAKNDRGYAVGPRQPDACQWCALGALVKCTPDDSKFKGEVNTKVMANALKVAAMFRRLVIGVGHSLVEFNDAHTHDEVLATFDAAIVQLRVGVDV